VQQNLKNFESIEESEVDGELELETINVPGEVSELLIVVLFFCNLTLGTTF